jgi:DNA invertase Pin-like site-specific DNA recombinase
VTSDEPLPQESFNELVFLYRGAEPCKEGKSRLSQFERSLIVERVRAGMTRARKQGKALGRPRVLNGEWEAMAPKIASGQISQRDAAKQLGCGRGTIQRRLKETVVSS